MPADKAVWNPSWELLSETEWPRRIALAVIIGLPVLWGAMLSFCWYSQPALWTTVIVGACVLIFVLSLLRLRWALYLYIQSFSIHVIMLFPLYDRLRGDDKVNPYHFCALALILGGSLNLLARAEGLRVRIRRPLFLFFFLAAASIAWSPYRVKAYIHLTFLFISFASYHFAWIVTRDLKTLQV